MKTFSAPKPAFSSKLWRRDKQLVARSEAPFPDRCVKCNAPASGFRLKRVVYWQPPVVGHGLGGIVAIIIKAIWMAVGQKKAKLRIGICPQHRAQRIQAIVIGWAGTIGGLVLMVRGATVFNSGWIELAGFILFVGCAIYGGVKGPVISATMTKDEFVFVNGVCSSFLADLPDWPHSR